MKLLALLLLLPSIAFGQLSGGVMRSQQQGAAAITSGTASGITLSNSTLGANNAYVTEDNITARAGGGQGSATALSATATLHNVTTVATAGDSVLLPSCNDGRAHFVSNSTVRAMQVFGTSPDTINGIATATGISMAPGQGLWFECITSGSWRASYGANGLPPIQSATWATINATTPPAGTTAYATDIGSGAHVSYVGSRWKPAGGRATVGFGAPQSGIANSETIACQALMPAASIATNDEIRIFFTGLSKSGTTDSFNMNIRVGTAGTTSDASVIALTPLGASIRAAGGLFAIKLVDATHMQTLNPSSLGSVSLSGTSAFPSSTAITSAASNALYVTITGKSSSTNDTVGWQGCTIEWATP